MVAEATQSPILVAKFVLEAALIVRTTGRNVPPHAHHRPPLPGCLEEPQELMSPNVCHCGSVADVTGFWQIWRGPISGRLPRLGSQAFSVRYFVIDSNYSVYKYVHKPYFQKPLPG
jgi:hypothetical protein